MLNRSFFQLKSLFELKYMVGVSIVLALLIGIYLQMAFGSINGFLLSLDHHQGLFVDYINHYQVMGAEIFITKLPSWGFYYSAFFAIILYPITNLSSGLFIWAGVQVFTLVGLFLLSAGIFCRGNSLRYLPIFTLFYFASVPLWHNFRWGQISTLLTLLAIGAFYLLSKRRILSALIALAVAISIKFYLLILVPFFLISKQYLYFVYVLLLSVFLIFVVPSVFLGITGTLNFYTHLQQTLSALDPTLDANSQSFSAVIGRLFIGDPTNIVQAHKYLISAGIFLGLANVVLGYIYLRKKVVSASWYIFCLLLGSIPLVISTSWPHYFVFLPISQLFLLTLNLSINLRWYRIFRLGLIILSALLTNVIFFRYIGDYFVFSSSGYYLFSDLLVLSVCYLDMLFVWRFNKPVSSK